MAIRRAEPESETQSTSRLHAWLSGTVQGVGMRWTVSGLAEARGLTGWVCNLDDGRVELVAEGPRLILEDLLEALRHSMGSYIRNIEQTWESPTGEWDSFRIAH